MITRLAQVGVGVGAALAVPLHLGEPRLGRLVRPSEVGGRRPASPDLALRAARRTIAGLVRLRVPGFRRTCLFRSVAECLVLRWYGHEAVVRIGVRADPEDPASIQAHAWVERPSIESREAYEVLRPAAPRGRTA